MNINDRIYGNFEINEQVLVELINCKAMQRLKDISQFGMPDEYYHKKGFSRFEHSVGVMLLLRKLGASLSEQIAGLLHDISHTAFSHVIDWVIGDPTKDAYQDDSFMEFIKKSEVPAILRRHGFDYNVVCDLEKFSLLENEAPNICADRVDYALREIVEFESPERFNLILKSLINHKGTIVFDSLEAAEMFSYDYAKCQTEHWAGDEAKARYYILGKILKRSLNLGIINISDFWKTDYEVINSLQESEDNEVLEGLLMLRKGFLLVRSNNEGAVILRKKFRYVNPFVLVEGHLVTLSELSDNYKKSLELQQRESKFVEPVEIIAR